jgi:hypothetical protein
LSCQDWTRIGASAYPKTFPPTTRDEGEAGLLPTGSNSNVKTLLASVNRFHCFTALLILTL